MKICTICKIPKPFEEFSPRKSAKDGLYSRCKTCHRKEVRDGYQKDPKSKLEDCKKCRQILLDITDVIKAERGCKACKKENDPVCLDFHHLDPTKKDLSIAKLVSNKSKQRMLDEIKKCVVVCANCHRKIHAGKIILPTDVVVA
jgi:hypothetical protein